MKKFYLSRIAGILFIISLSNQSAFASARAEIAELQDGQQNLLQRIELLESRLQNQGLLELFNTITQLQKEVQQLRGQIEQQNNEINGLRNRQRELYLDIDRRLNELAIKQGNPDIATPVAATAAATAAAATGSTSIPKTDNSVTDSATASVLNTKEAEAEQAYKNAFEILKDGRYPQAITSFQQFITDYPDSYYVDNAQYWLGEAHYVSRQFDEALAAFGTLLQRYPDSNKAADSQLKIGYTYYELQQWEQAKKALNTVINKYPNTSAATLAEQRLLRLKSNTPNS